MKECNISEQNPPIATLLIDNTKQYRKNKKLLDIDKYIGNTSKNRAKENRIKFKLL